MGLSSALSMEGTKVAIIAFLGAPIIAIAVGVIFGLYLLIGQKKTKYQYTFSTKERGNFLEA